MRWSSRVGVLFGLVLSLPLAACAQSAFTNVPIANLPNLWGGSVVWGDYDNDGLLDFFLTGFREGAQIWRNIESGFTNVTTTVAPALPRIEDELSAVAWGDYDNDGRLDFLISGNNNSQSIAQIWRNTEIGFTNVTASIAPGLRQEVYRSVVWGDYDNDGRLDFLLAGARYFPAAQIWRNTGSEFTNVTASVAPGLPQVVFSSVAWGDYDNDGQLDFLLTGSSGIQVSQIWRNTGSGFTNVTATVAPELPGVYLGSVAWGDYDNDGYVDFLLVGRTNWLGIAQLWRNTGSAFTNEPVPGLRGVSAATAAWGDYDNDGRLDFVLMGTTNGGPLGNLTQLWRNTTTGTNAPPGAPTGLAMTATTNAVMLSWNFALDDHTPVSGLTYNVRAGTTPSGIDLLSAHVDANTGFRRVPALGNAMLRHSLPLTGLTNGQTVYWSVQAVDTSFSGGPFATEMSVVSIPQLAITPISTTTAIVSWSPPTWGWQLQESTDIGANLWSNSPSGAVNPTNVPTTNGAKLYRLTKP